jgi:hypothetical protein
MTECTYCGSRVEDHEGVFVQELTADDEREEAGAFCNYACLSAHVEERDLVSGAACRFDPE